MASQTNDLGLFKFLSKKSRGESSGFLLPQLDWGPSSSAIFIQSLSRKRMFGNGSLEGKVDFGLRRYPRTLYEPFREQPGRVIMCRSPIGETTRPPRKKKPPFLFVAIKIF